MADGDIAFDAVAEDQIVATLISHYMDFGVNFLANFLLHECSVRQINISSAFR